MALASTCLALARRSLSNELESHINQRLCDSLLDCFLFKIADMFVGKFDTITGFDQCLVSFSFSGLGVRDTLTRTYDTLIVVEEMLVASSAKDSASEGTTCRAMT